jgi:hypothetical protein
VAKENIKNWVDYKEIKEKISLPMVLGHYGIELKKSGQNLTGCCPIHQGTNKRQFSVSPERNIWNCFGNCKVGLLPAKADRRGRQRKRKGEPRQRADRQKANLSATLGTGKKLPVCLVALKKS